MPDQIASAVADHIKTEEKMLQDGLEEMYVNMTDETFKVGVPCPLLTIVSSSRCSHLICVHHWLLP